jgi:hypothetical protein
MSRAGKRSEPAAIISPSSSVSHRYCVLMPTTAMHDDVHPEVLDLSDEIGMGEDKLSGRDGCAVTVCRPRERGQPGDCGQ